MKITTKTGDTGTSEIAQGRISKRADIFHLLGKLDEVMAELICLANAHPTEKNTCQKQVAMLSRCSAIVAGYLAWQSSDERFIENLEQEIKTVEEMLPGFSFVYPFDQPLAAAWNKVRVLVRQAELLVWQIEPPYYQNLAVLFNRLSDWCYSQICRNL